MLPRQHLVKPHKKNNLIIIELHKLMFVSCL